MTSPTGRIVRNAAFALTSQLVTAAFTAAITLLLIRVLSPSEFGTYSLAFAIVGVLALPADFGLAHATARFVAEHRGDPGAVRALVGDAAKLKLAAGLVVCGGLAAAAGPIASAYNAPGLVWPLRAMAVALFAQTFMTFFTYALVAQERFSANLRIILAESATEAAAVFALVLAVGGATAAAAGRAVGYTAGALFAAAATWRTLGRRRSRERGPWRLREVGAYAGALLIVDAAYTLFDQIDVLLIGAYLGTAAAGVFQAPLRLTIFLFSAAAALSAVVTPSLAAGTRTPQAVARFREMTRVVAAVQALLVAPVVAWATPIMHLIAPGYTDSPDVLRALAPYVFLTGLALLYSVAANYLGEARRRIPVAVGALVLNLVIDVVLIPRIGVVGGAVGTDVAFVLYAAGNFAICAAILDLPLVPLLVTLARCLLAGAGAAGVLAAFGTESLSLVDWLVGPVAAVAAFAALLVATREFTPAQLARLRSSA